MIMSGHRYNVFDFNGTLYDGECFVDYCMFVIRKYDFWRIRFLPLALWSFGLYRLGWMSKKTLNRNSAKITRGFVNENDNVDAMVFRFWATNKDKLNQEILNIMFDSEYAVIISSGLGFLIEGARKYLGKVQILSSAYDIKEGRYTYLNTGPAKAKTWKKFHENDFIGDVYTDTEKKDDPLWQIALGKLHVVKHGKIVKVKNHH